MTFIRKQEDFVCEHCGANVVGNGYTNHCPNCLWSKHVDIEPGDRGSDCGGMMQPISIEGATGKGYRIRHKCEKCGHEKMNYANDMDSSDALVALAKSKE